MKAFTIKIGDKILDYRLGQNLDLRKFQKHLENKGYVVEKLWNEKRHNVGQISKDKTKLFVKLATSEGMSRLTENEFEWNKQFNKQNSREKSNFWVPINFDSGYFESLFYLVTDFGKGKKISGHEPDSLNSLPQTLNQVIDFSELIQSLSLERLNPNEYFTEMNYKQRFLEKTKQWLEAIPQRIRQKYHIGQLLKVVEEGTPNLESKARHGDFTPWHIFNMGEDKLYLFDAEHALSEGAEYYDIAYYTQRVFSVLKNEKITLQILDELRKRSYDFSKLKTVMAARAIGGFLDSYLGVKNSDYKADEEFRDLVLSI